MNKLRILSLGLSFLLMTTGVSFAQEKGKIAYVNLSRLFDEYSKTKEYDKVLESQHADFEKQRNAKIEQIREAQGKLALLKEDKKAELDQNIEKMKADLLEYDRQQKQDLTKDRNEKIRKILLEIEKIVSAYAKDQNYDYILNDRVLIYGNQALDKTEDVLKILNESKPAK